MSKAFKNAYICTDGQDPVYDIPQQNPQLNVDDLLAIFDGGIHAKGKEGNGYPTYFDKPYYLWVEDRKDLFKQRLLSLIMEVIGEDEVGIWNKLFPDDVGSGRDIEEIKNLYENQIRAEQRLKAQQLFNPKKGE